MRTRKRKNVNRRRAFQECPPFRNATDGESQVPQEERRVPEHHLILYNMDIAREELIAKRKWARLLRSLRAGTHRFQLGNNNLCNSLRSVATRLNKDGHELNLYDVTFDYKKSIITILVTRRE